MIEHSPGFIAARLAVLLHSGYRCRGSHVPSDVVNLMRLAKRHRTLMERACSDPRGSGPKHDAAVARVRDKIRDIVCLYECDVRFSGDPRGNTVFLDSGIGSMVGL